MRPYSFATYRAQQAHNKRRTASTTLTDRRNGQFIDKLTCRTFQTLSRDWQI